jgi:MFS family permease
VISAPGDADGSELVAAGDRRIVVAVIASTFFVGFGGGVVFPILPNLGVVLGISPFVVGLILSANRLTRLFANAPAGIVVDRIGTRPPFVAGLLLEGVATTGYVVAITAAAPEAWFLLSRIVWGVGSAMVFATAYTVAADVSDGKSRGTNMGLVRGGILFGFPAGLVVGGIVSELAGTGTAFVVAAAFAFIATGLAFVAVPETHVEGGIHRSVKPWDVDTSVPAVSVGLVNFAVLFVYIGVMFSTLVLYIDVNDLSVLGLGPQGLSGLFMAMTVVSAAVFVFLSGYVSDKRGSRMPAVCVFLLVTGIGFVALAGADTAPTLVVACVLIGIGQGGTSGPLMALLADLTPDERMGRAVGTNNVFGEVGGALGPLVSLPLVETVGFWPVYTVCAVVPVLAGGVLLAGVYRETDELLPRVERPLTSEPGDDRSLD